MALSAAHPPPLTQVFAMFSRIRLRNAPGAAPARIVTASPVLVPTALRVRADGAA
jgi:hypothetical protein